MAYDQELNAALRAVQKASVLCRKVQRTLVTEETIEKKDKSPVTVADLGSQSVISLDLLESWELLDGEDRGPLREIFDANPLLFDYVLKRRLRLDAEGGPRRFPPAVFETARLFG